MDRRDFLRAGAGAIAGVGVAGELASPAEATTSQFFRGPPGEPGRRSDAWVGLNRGHLTANFQKVKERAGGRPVMAVVKADGYGHGIVPVAQTLAQAGADAFLVTNTQEAVALKNAEIEQPVLHFGRAFGGAGELIIQHGIEQMVDSRDAVSPLVAAAAMQQAEVVVQVHVDTGLGRMGVPWQQAGELIEYVGSRSRVRLAGVSTALTEDPEFDRVQVGRLQAIVEAARSSGIEVGRVHAASSAAVFADPDAHLDMVRPGIALYGHYPSDTSRERDADVGLQPVMGLRARVVEVKRLEQGDSVGYHRIHVAEGPQTIAVLPVGHSDGYPPEAAAGGGYAWIRGARCPFVGGIDANHSKVLVPEDLGLQIGEVATLIATGAERDPFGAASEPASVEQGADPFGGPPTADMVAAWSGTSVYRVLMRINPKLPRVYEGQRRR